MTTPVAVPGRAWLMLALGLASQVGSTFLISTPTYLIPLLHLRDGLSLSQAGLLASAPAIGTMLTLVLWGAAADKYGEREVLVCGLVLSAIAASGAAMTSNHLFVFGLFFAIAGMAAASTSSASGRVVIGWFPKERRGFAMGIRQMSTPLGMALAALIVPPLASQHSIATAVYVSVLLNAVLAIACAVYLENPSRTLRVDATVVNPYRRDRFLVRIHVVSLLLVVPQFTVTIFGLVWLTEELHWGAFAAGLVVGLAQIVGAVGRLAVGGLSDRVNSRVRPLRWVAWSAVIVMLLLSLGGASHWGIAAAALVLATVVSVADNGLAFTAVAESAGPSWSGKALGIQNTGQFMTSSLVGPGVGLLITSTSYATAFGLVAIFPAIAIALVPARDSHA